MDRDLAAFGASDAARERFRAAMRDADDDDDGEMPILPENWDAVGVFCACATQWEHYPDGTFKGLRYPSVESVMRMTDVDGQADCLARVRVMEAEVVKASRDRK